MMILPYVRGNPSYVILETCKNRFIAFNTRRLEKALEMLEPVTDQFS
jgi:hypothetical protein